MSEIIIEETKWEDLEEVRSYEENSYDLGKAYEAYEEFKEQF